jgi:hypothetical protein
MLLATNRWMGRTYCFAAAVAAHGTENLDTLLDALSSGGEAVQEWLAMLIADVAAHSERVRLRPLQPNSLTTRKPIGCSCALALVRGARRSDSLRTLQRCARCNAAHHAATLRNTLQPTRACAAQAAAARAPCAVHALGGDRVAARRRAGKRYS